MYVLLYFTTSHRIYSYNHRTCKTLYYHHYQYLLAIQQTSTGVTISRKIFVATYWGFTHNYF
jgi:hypothetical protein